MLAQLARRDRPLKDLALAGGLLAFAGTRTK
jgi:hypothetical protein